MMDDGSFKAVASRAAWKGDADFALLRLLFCGDDPPSCRHTDRAGEDADHSAEAGEADRAPVVLVAHARMGTERRAGLRVAALLVRLHASAELPSAVAAAVIR
jgi:hypothetical protein